MGNNMKLGIMQPYFFPYIGYFELIYQTNRWIVFDTAQYIRHGWVNRNRILHPREGWQYIILPTLKHDQKTVIKDICIPKGDKWRKKLNGQLQHYKKKAPFFRSVVDMVSESLDCSEDALSHLNVKSLERVCEYLEIPFNFSLFSEMKLDLGLIEGPGDWALRIAQALGADEYINAPGGADLFDRTKFEQANIRLTIQKPTNYEYDCDGYMFQPNLSIIDVMMWNSSNEIHSYLVSRK
jgi:hypothetical protein